MLAIGSDTDGARTEDLLSFTAVLMDCNARVGFCKGYILAVGAAGGTAGAAFNFEMALGPISGEGRTGVIFLFTVSLDGVLGGITGATFELEVVLGISAVERGIGTVFIAEGTIVAEGAGVSSAADITVEFSWNTAAGADRTGAVFLFKAFVFSKAVGVVSGAAFNFEVAFGTAY